jgi:hypothetical protein
MTTAITMKMEPSGLMCIVVFGSARKPELTQARSAGKSCLSPLRMTTRKYVRGDSFQ